MPLSSRRRARRRLRARAGRRHAGTRAVLPLAVAASLVLGVATGRALGRPTPRGAGSADVGAEAEPATLPQTPKGEQQRPGAEPRSVEDLRSLTKVVTPGSQKPPVVPRDGWHVALDNGHTPGPVPPLPDLPGDLLTTLALADIHPDAFPDHAEVRAIAGSLGIGGPTRLSAETLDELLLRARRIPAPLLTLAGIDVGVTVDTDDLVRAASTLGVAYGEVVDPVDVRRILAEAGAQAAPALFASGHDPGRALDAGDLLRIAGGLLGAPATSGSQGELTPATLVSTGQQALRRVERRSPAPGVDLSTWQVRLPDGPAVARVVRWQVDDTRLRLRTVPSGGLNGLATVPAHARALVAAAERAGDHRPVVVANGAFWLGRGEPDGLLVEDGFLLSDPTMRRSWIRGRRGAFGVGPDGAVAGRPDWLAQLLVGDRAIDIRGVNRPLDLDNDVVAFTNRWGASTGTPPGTVEVVLHGVTLRQATSAITAVAEVRTAGNAPIPPDGIVLASHGARSIALGQLAAGTEARIVTQATPGWNNLTAGLGGGPLLLQDGAATSAGDWFAEGFGDYHNARRHPRTAIGFTAGGEALLVVVDGRRPGYSIGMTTRETTRLLRAFGAIDAVMLDGGSSSHLVVDGRTLNRPCCDPGPRPVSTMLVLDHLIGKDPRG